MKDYVILLILILACLLGILYYEMNTYNAMGDDETITDHKTVISFYSISDKTSIKPVTIRMSDGSTVTTNQSYEFNSSDIDDATLIFNATGYLPLELYVENANNINSLNIYLEPTPTVNSGDDTTKVARVYSQLPIDFLIAETGRNNQPSISTSRSGVTNYSFELHERDYSIFSFGNRHQVYVGIRVIKDSARIDVVLDNCMGMMGANSGTADPHGLPQGQ